MRVNEMRVATVEGYEAQREGVILSYKANNPPMKDGVGTVLTPSLMNGGYHKVVLHDMGKRKTRLVHRMVAEAFIDNPEGKPFVNHIDGNKINNHVDNLEWVTAQENIDHAVATGLRCTKGESNGKAVLGERDVKVIRFMLELKYRQTDIAEKFNVSKASISKIATGRTWSES